MLASTGNQNNLEQPAPTTAVTPTTSASALAPVTPPTNHTSASSAQAQQGEDQEHDDITEESEKNARKNKEKKHDAGAADLERVTDYAEETEISASDISAVRFHEFSITLYDWLWKARIAFPRLSSWS